MLHNSSDGDAVAQAQAQQARNEGVRIITSHLASHLDQNPGSDFVSWIATLHPENAEVQIDSRFFVPNNPWWSVYEAAKPAATVVVDGVPANSVNNAELTETGPQPHGKPSSQSKGCFCNPVGFIVGIALTFASILATFSIEVTALLIYFLAAVCFNISVPCNPPSNPIGGIVFSVFILLYWIFSMVDSLLLLVSVLVSEVLGFVSGMVGCLCGGYSGAKEWHQTVRKSSHLLRATFRKPFKSPSRHLFCSSSSTVSDEDSHGSSSSNASSRAYNGKPTVAVIPEDGNEVSCCSGEQTKPTIAVLVGTIGEESPAVNPDHQTPEAYKYANKQ